MAIDLHAHYIPKSLVDIFEKKSDGPRISYPDQNTSLYHMPISTLPFSSAYYDMDERMDILDNAGIEKQVISLPGLFGIDYLPLEQSLPIIKQFNEELAQDCQKYNDRIMGLAALPLADIDEMMVELKKSVEDYGFKGAILPNNSFLSLDYANELKPLFEYANQKKLHFFIHPGWRADEYPVLDNRPNDPDELLIARGALGVQHSVSLAFITLLFTDFLDQFPNMTVHMANLGGTFPMVVERMHHTVEARFPNAKMPPSSKKNLYVDTSSLGPRAIELAAEIYGVDKLVVGTDTPIFNPVTGISSINETRLSQSEKDMILKGNAERILS